MANYTYLVPPFTTTTFTSPVAGTDDVITANVLADFTINGNGGNDVVRTAGGNDTITTGSGNDVIAAGNGNNTVTAGDGTNAVTTGSGDDTITTGTGADVVNSGSGNDIITTGGGNDRINSGGGNDSIKSGGGNDRIISGGGNDKVNAGTGNDRITAGGGIDALIGGGGHDTFVYARLADARLGADTISDFSTSNPTGAGEGDMLYLQGLVDDFTGLQGGSLAQLVPSGHFDFSAGGGGTVISFDSNGSAAGGSIGVLATLVGVPFTNEGASALAFGDNILV